MSHEKLVPYVPSAHAGPAPRYRGNHVVVNPFALADIAFDPKNDNIAKYVGTRDPASCPQVDTLVANPTSPPIIPRAEAKQFLQVPCEARQDIVNSSKGEGVAYPVCSDKARRLGLDLADLSTEWLTDPDKRQAIDCPFAALGGVAAASGASVEVVVSAVNPVQPNDIFRTK